MGLKLKKKLNLDMKTKKILFEIKEKLAHLGLSVSGLQRKYIHDMRSVPEYSQTTITF